MLTRLRISLAAITSLLTGAVLAVAVLLGYGISRELYLSGREAAFVSAVDQVQMQWLRYSTLDSGWLNQLESSGDLAFYLEENGVPLLYSLRQPDTAQAVFDKIRQSAEQSFNVSLSAAPLTSTSGKDLSFSLTENGTVYRCAVRLSAPKQGQWTTLLAFQDTAPEEAYCRALAVRFACVAFAGWVLLTLIGWLISGQAVRPVAQAFRSQQAFLSAAGHELRTPLAVIRANAGAARQQPGKVWQYLHVIDEECARMGTLVDDLLLLSAGTSARQRLNPEPIEPDAFLLDFAESMEPLARRCQRRLQADLPDQAVPKIRADAYRLRQVLTVLLDNALRFAPENTTIHLRLTTARGQVRFTVEDGGPGVPVGERKRIFDRFYRIGGQGDARHYGLGLSVARELTQLHGGRIWVEDTPDGGAAFCVSFPAAADD